MKAFTPSVSFVADPRRVDKAEGYRLPITAVDDVCYRV